MSQLVALLRGKPVSTDSLGNLTQRVVDRVEPEIWGLVHERIPTGSYAEARGYVWARAALPVARTTNDVARGVRPSLRAQIAAESRAVIADRIVEQLRMYQDRLQARRAA